MKLLCTKLITFKLRISCSVSHSCKLERLGKSIFHLQSSLWPFVFVEGFPQDRNDVASTCPHCHGYFYIFV
jgi:hypothetical protein